ncbi:MAG: hypothetical protein NTV41_05805 [Actinobacteria bacterium]|nr:hypothetical protein [Actinomycetota bacterium]
MKLKLSRKLSFTLIATLALLGLGGVTAAQVITINNDAPLNMGEGAINTAACDNLISVSGTQYSTGIYVNPYQRYGNFVVSDIDLRAAPLGCGGQLLRMVVIDDTNAIQQASWTLPTRSDYATITFTFGTTNLRSYAAVGSGGTYNASLALASVGIMDMKQIAIGISGR